jgi:hypothetical protein
MITPEPKDHSHKYTFQVTTDASSTGSDIPLGKSFTLSLQDVSSSVASKDLVADMVQSQEGIVFDSTVSWIPPTDSSNLRTVVLPMPNSICTDALLFGGVSAGADQLNRVPNAKYFPTALALIYWGTGTSGNWGTAKWSEAPDGHVDTYSCSPGNPTHLRFSVCRKGHCDLPQSVPPERVCDMLKEDEDHASYAFSELISLLTFTPAPTSLPELKFEPKCQLNDAKIAVYKGKNSNLKAGEVGLPDNAPHESETQKDGRYRFFAQLHNCAAPNLIVGAGV